MRFIIVILSVLLAGCQSTQMVLCNGKNLSVKERVELEHKATEGDAEAAWRLSFYQHDETAADLWLRRAAELKHPQAQRQLADLIKDYEHSPDGFGDSAPDAVQHLLEKSAETDGSACFELASAYGDGYFGSSNQSKARAYFLRGAGFNNRRCWKMLSQYYRNGTGGPREDAEAYYWISLEARCVDPRSISGQETWAAREEIASHLSLSILEHEWKRIDAFIADVADKKMIVYFAPFLSGMIDPKDEAEGRRLSQQVEDEHRKKHKSENS